MLNVQLAVFRSLDTKAAPAPSSVAATSTCDCGRPSPPPVTLTGRLSSRGRGWGTVDMLRLYFMEPMVFDSLHAE